MLARCTLKETSPSEPMDVTSWKFIVLFRLVLSSVPWDASAALAEGSINQGEGNDCFQCKQQQCGGSFSKGQQESCTPTAIP